MLGGSPLQGRLLKIFVGNVHLLGDLEATLAFRLFCAVEIGERICLSWDFSGLIV